MPSGRILSNHHTDIEVWDVDPGAGRGPFVVTQAGVAPGDLQVRDGLFVLRPDGRWIDVSYYLALGRPEAFDEVVFPDMAAVMRLLQSLGPEAQMADLPVSDEGLRVWQAWSREKAGLDDVRAWLAGYRERRKFQG